MRYMGYNSKSGQTKFRIDVLVCNKNISPTSAPAEYEISKIHYAILKLNILNDTPCNIKRAKD